MNAGIHKPLSYLAKDFIPINMNSLATTIQCRKQVLVGKERC
jgi:hypothetical protein